MDLIDFGSYIKGIREAKKLSLTDLSKLSGVSQPYLSQVETGKRGAPSPEMLRKLSGPLGAEYSEMMIKAGHITYKEWSEAFIQEDFNVDEDEVYKRIISNQEKAQKDIKNLLASTEDISYNGHKLTDNDRKRTLDILAILFPEYTK